MQEARLNLITQWFEGLNEGRSDDVAALFSPVSHRIKNAAAPEQSGPTAAKEVLSEFLTRTSARTFAVKSIAHGMQLSFAWWIGELTFADGAVIAGHPVKPFTATVEGIDVFDFDENGRITSMDIVHQTTTVAIAAAANTKEA